MMDYLLIPEERKKILKRKREWIQQLEKFSNSKIEINEVIKVECEDPLMLLRVKEVLKAFGRGFDFNSSLLLLDESYFLEIIRLDEFAGKSRKRQIVLKGRVIGTEGKTKKMIERYTNTKIAVYGKTVSIIGRAENVRKAREAVEMLLSGAMHRTVYRFLERI